MHPIKTPKKLIEFALPLDAINVAVETAIRVYRRSYRVKRIAGGYQHTFLADQDDYSCYPSNNNKL